MRQVAVEILLFLLDFFFAVWSRPAFVRGRAQHRPSPGGGHARGDPGRVRLSRSAGIGVGADGARAREDERQVCVGSGRSNAAGQSLPKHKCNKLKGGKSKSLWWCLRGNMAKHMGIPTSATSPD